MEPKNAFYIPTLLQSLVFEFKEYSRPLRAFTSLHSVVLLATKAKTLCTLCFYVLSASIKAMNECAFANACCYLMAQRGMLPGKMT